MGDDETVVVVPPAVSSEPAPPTPGELWHAEHQQRHLEHMAHLETIREEHRAEVAALREKVAELEGVVIGLATAPPPEPVDSAALSQALDTVETVGEVIANVTEALNPEEVVETPTPPSHHDSTGPAGEVAPDVGTPGGNEQPSSGRRRGGRFW